MISIERNTCTSQNWLQHCDSQGLAACFTDRLRLLALIRVRTGLSVETVDIVGGRCSRHSERIIAKFRNDTPERRQRSGQYIHVYLYCIPMLLDPPTPWQWIFRQGEHCRPLDEWQQHNKYALWQVWMIFGPIVKSKKKNLSTQTMDTVAWPKNLRSAELINSIFGHFGSCRIKLF